MNKNSRLTRLTNQLVPGVRGLRVIFGVAGVLHFYRPVVFDSIVPRWVPGSARTATYLSGAAELGVAAGLSVAKTRAVAGYAAVALLLAVFPGNVEMARQWVPQSPLKAFVSLARLPLQISLIQGAWRVAKKAEKA